MSESIYKDALPELEAVCRALKNEITKIRENMNEMLGMDPVEHLLSRIKSDESMREKCRRKGLPETPESALEEIHDAIGIRIVCAFIDDIYTIRDSLEALPGVSVTEEKDYIKNVKPNGYRSFHMILKCDDGFAGLSLGRSYYAEIQLRTISMDTWAALEHHLKYKKNITGNISLIEKELKRCADELAGTDNSMQTLRDMIREL